MASDSRTSGWEEHRRAQILRWARATPAARLAWLESAIALAVRTGALPRSAPSRDDDRKR